MAKGQRENKGFPYKVRQVGAHKQPPDGSLKLQAELAPHSDRDASLPVVLHALEIH